MISQLRIFKRLQAQEEPVDWEKVYTDQLPRVYNYFRYRLNDEAAAEDLTALTFEKAWRKRDSYRRDLGAFSTWLFTIAQNQATDYFRSRKPETGLEDLALAEDGPSIEETIQLRGDLERLGALLAGLSERERNLVALKYGADLTNRAVAQLTGLSETNVGTILNRVVTRLRGLWELLP